MSEQFGGEDRQKALKEIVRQLHEGSDIGKVRKQFASLIKDVSPQEIAQMEQALIAEGVPVEQVQKVCDVHVAVFEDTLKKRGKVKTPPGHPIRTFTDENKAAKRVVKDVQRLVRVAGRTSIPPELHAALDELKLVELHYLRKENLLFPLLEQAEFTGPSKVMWGKHDEIRGHIKAVEAALKAGKIADLKSNWAKTARAIRRMIFMEEKILFPNAVKLLSDGQWAQIRRGEAEIGYAWVKPGNLWDANIAAARDMAQNLGRAGETATRKEPEIKGIPLDVGELDADQINLMLKSLPVDITYVDEHDKVRYYSQGRERLFPRTPAIIGREVRNCHPPKSVHVVERIIQSFRDKEKDTAEFWLELGGKFIHIRYFAMYGKNGEYRGVIEMSQDVTDIRKLSGEQRLLDWD